MNRDARRGRRYEWRMGRVPGGIELEAKKPEILADACPHDVGTFADSTGEDEHVESGERSGVGTDLLADRVTVDRDSHSASFVGRLARDQLTHIRRPAGERAEAG